MDQAVRDGVRMIMEPLFPHPLHPGTVTQNDKQRNL